MKRRTSFENSFYAPPFMEMTNKDLRSLLTEYLVLKKQGIRKSSLEKELIKRHCIYFRKWLGEKRPTALFGYQYPQKNSDFWDVVDEIAAEAFVNFDTEDVILNRPGKSLLERLIDQKYSNSQIEHILYRGFCIHGKRCECAAIMFLKKTRQQKWREQENAHATTAIERHTRKKSRRNESLERQRENAYINLRRVLTKEFLLFLLTNKDNFYKTSEKGCIHKKWGNIRKKVA